MQNEKVLLYLIVTIGVVIVVGTIIYLLKDRITGGSLRWKKLEGKFTAQPPSETPNVDVSENKMRDENEVNIDPAAPIRVTKNELRDRNKINIGPGASQRKSE